MRRTLLLIYLLGIFAGCQRRPVPPKAEVGSAIAQVDQRVITDQELLAAIDIIKKKYPREFSTHPEKKSLLDQLINVELLADAALKNGLDKEFEFKTRLADLYVQRLSDAVRSKVKDEDLIKYHRENARTIDQVGARHILIRLDSQKRDEALAKAKSILAEVRAKPESFSDLAIKYSQDKSGQRGGDLGLFSYEMMVEPFAKAAFALKNVGDISPIVETEYGFHIIQLSADNRGFEKNRGIVTDRYIRGLQRKIFDQEIARLRSSKKIQFFEDALLKISPLPTIVTKDPDETLDYKPPSSAR